jgi:hypothetical protein
MSAPARRDDPFRRTFALGAVAALAVMICLGGLIKVFGTGADRPEGAAERWLVAVGDTTRDGVAGDARDRAERIGPLALGAPLLPTVDTDGDAAFSDLEVGNADESGGVARVPFRLHQYAETGDEPVLTGSVVLGRVDGDWAITAIDTRRPGEEVPSEGGAPPSNAPLGVWLGGLALGLLLCTLASLAVRTAGRGTGAPAPG